MTTYTVEGHIGTLYATVEADDNDLAMKAAVEQWDAESLDIFCAATFEVRKSDN